LASYEKIFNMNAELVAEDFLLLPPSDLTRFLTELVVYDAEEDSRGAYGYPPSSPFTSQDIVVFNRETCRHYIDSFTSLWLEHKESIP
jgi:hypothetical protein